MKPRSHTHDWQWSEQQHRYLCHCGESMLSEPEDTPRVEPIEPPKLVQTRCWSCLGSGYSDYAITQPCTVCGGWGYWEGLG